MSRRKAGSCFAVAPIGWRERQREKSSEQRRSETKESGSATTWRGNYGCRRPRRCDAIEDKERDKRTRTACHFPDSQPREGLTGAVSSSAESLCSPYCTPPAHSPTTHPSTCLTFCASCRPPRAHTPAMNGAQPARHGRPAPAGPTPPAPAAAPPVPPNGVAGAHAPPAARPPNGAGANGTAHAPPPKGKKKPAEQPVDPSQMYETLKNRIVALEEEEVHEEEEERRFGAWCGSTACVYAATDL